MMDGLRTKDLQKRNLDDEMLLEIEKEMERKAIANSMIEIKNNPHHEEEVRQIVQHQPDDERWAQSSLVDSVMVEEEKMEEELKQGDE